MQRDPLAAVLPADSGGESRSQVSRWLAWGLDRNAGGIPLTNLNNAVAVLEHDLLLKGHVWFDEFLNRMLTLGVDGKPREWQAVDDDNLALYMQRGIGLQKMSSDTVSRAVRVVAYRDVRNCARDWMSSLQWDDTGRIETFFIDVFGAADSDYTRAAGRNFWISLAARVMAPGCQVDNMVVLEGLQGKGKSSAAQIIGGEWYAAQHESPTNSRAFAEILQGKILVEIEEMHAFSRAETEAVKKSVTVRSDRFRPSGAHGYAKDHPRYCVFLGTTNRDDWNRDETGARRFWPIRCMRVDIQRLEREREQFFAEAVARYKAGESWWEMPEEETKAEQDARYHADPWFDDVQFMLTEQRGRRGVLTTELLEQLGIDRDRWTRGDEMRVGSILRKLGWQRRRVRDGLKLHWKYFPGENGGNVGTGENLGIGENDAPF